MSPLLRYSLLQLPALGFLALIVLALWRFAALPGWAAAALVIGWAIKDAAFYPLLRSAYTGPGGSGTLRLVGQRGVARQDLAPRGYVALGTELWRAEVEPGAAPIAAGRGVRVVGAHRLTLIVAACGEDKICTGGSVD
jgi:membrane protein implicated in regulation of membrane protease activity